LKKHYSNVYEYEYEYEGELLLDGGVLFLFYLGRLRGKNKELFVKLWYDKNEDYI
jgi:hypothetical protein